MNTIIVWGQKKIEKQVQDSNPNLLQSSLWCQQLCHATSTMQEVIGGFFFKLRHHGNACMQKKVALIKGEPNWSLQNAKETS